MSDRFAYLYGRSETFDFRAMIRQLSSKGITLENPANGRVTYLSEDGDQLVGSSAFLEKMIAEHQPLTFQFWMPDHADVCCHIRNLSQNRIVEEYDMVGLSETERDHVVDALIARFKFEAAREDYLFFVVDREGYTIDVDWNKLSIEGKYDFAVCPDVLGFSLDRFDDLKVCISEKDLITLGTFLLADNRPKSAKHSSR